MLEVFYHIKNNIYLITFLLVFICIAVRHRRFKIYINSDINIYIFFKESIFILKVVGIMSLLFGAMISLEVAFGVGDRSWWLMPLIFGPIEFIRRVGIMALVVNVSAVWLVYKTKKHIRL